MYPAMIWGVNVEPNVASLMAGKTLKDASRRFPSICPARERNIEGCFSYNPRYVGGGGDAILISAARELCLCRAL